MVSEKIPYGKQSIQEDDLAAVQKALQDDFLTTGPKIKEFEEKFANYVGAKYAVAVSSGTAALHLACLAAGLKPGEELITSPLSFVASANCTLYCGATPVFADITEQGLIDPAEVEKKITAATKIILPVHYGGLPCDLEAIQKIASKHNLVVIEDACHALGARYKESKIGDCTYSQMSCFSFHPVKHITTGEGGMITTNSKDLYEKLLKLRTHGITKNPELFWYKDEGPWHQEMQELGYNYRMTDFQCALGMSQLTKIDSFIEKRRELANKYGEAFKKNPELEMVEEQNDLVNSYHLFILKVKNGKIRRTLFEYLKERDILCQVHYLPIYLQPYYRQKGYKPRLCPNAEQFYEKIISLPIYPSLMEQEQNRVIVNIQQFFMSTRKSRIAIIPARGGSKRIPRKNIKHFLGKPIITYSIECAIKSGLFDEVMVSTDDKEIAEIAIRAGAKVPFLRSEKTANDFAHLAEVMGEVLERYELQGKTFDYFCCLLPTAPFVSVEKMQECFSLMIEKNYDSVCPVRRYTYPIQRALKIEGEKLSMINPENLTKRSQDLMPAYHDSGQFYWMKTESFKRHKLLWTTNSGAVILSDLEVQDIDTEEDWKIAEVKYRILQDSEYASITEEKPKVSFKVGTRIIGSNQPCFIIAEAGVNHNGDFNLAKKLIDVAAAAGVDAVKFQWLTAEGLYVPDAGHFRNEWGEEVDIYQVWKKTEFPGWWIPDLAAYAQSKGLILFASVFDEKGVDILDRHVGMFKIASSETTHLPLLKKAAFTGKPLIFSIGGAQLKEVQEAVATVASTGNKSLSILHCVAKYPAPPSSANLKALKTISTFFPEVVVGYSDHTMDYMGVPSAAVALGAKIIEKHFTLSRAMEGIDHKMSLEPAELKQMVQVVRETEKQLQEGKHIYIDQAWLGDGEITLTEEQRSMMKFVRRKIFVVKPIKKGEVFNPENISVLRPGNRQVESALDPKHYWEIMGKKASCDLFPYTVLTKEDWWNE
ncbi:MAG: hypothetical protein A2822_04470 [Candidatus Staskawiczbacteria bacterium RIFCSPHIGHO2_01_FULL_41_41]|uniref:AFP-like domain-containing protein n=1 Tax=Candidatus Staskawiczbacteria bacterium RIFCSPHIGHO2_01_FULL_41_41 TaxID=1802203 RepID=A0A1G2HS84_9BACT|nr:MAG: hypothetical protein A2822_04470 [Candidatus Staskawiczbacteria bacterium RIFCSPHIGHO2_01_FULL_41_41]HLD80283.1 UDP-4-amino-4,6-dideoxy-N-acetyl-beta-L-altrosamine transaminase [Candidatus Nanoarchaeia archaeon]